MGPPVKLHVFDFDGTLFRSPEKPEDWAGGWWGRLESLSPPLVPQNPDFDWWNGSVVSAAKKAISKPNEMAIMVTGRIPKFSLRVKDLLKQAGLTGFDAMYFSGGGATDAYKIGVMKELLAQYPTIRGVAIWEDRSEHLRKFADWVEANGRAAYPHLITVAPHPIDPPPSPERVALALRVASRHGSSRLGTKTDGEKEDEQAEAMVKPLPKAKPPRQDLRKQRLDTEDSDLDTEDDDLSLNYKKVALLFESSNRVALRFLYGDADSSSSSEEFKAWVEGRKFTHPETKNEVEFSSLPEEAQSEIRKTWDSDKKDEKSTPEGGSKNNEEEVDPAEAKKNKDRAKAEKKKREDAAAKRKRTELKDSLLSFKDSPIFTNDQKSDMKELLGSLFDKMSDDDLKSYVDSASATLAKGVEQVAKSGKPPSPKSSVNIGSLKKIKERLDKELEEYDDAKIDIEANDDPSKEAELKGKLEKAKSKFDSTKQELADGFKSYYADTSVQAAARNPTIWVPASDKPLEDDKRTDRVKETIKRYDSYSSKDKRIAFDQLKEVATTSDKRLKEIDAVLSGDSGDGEGSSGEDSPYRTEPKEPVDRSELLKERDELLSKSSYFRADMQALTLHLVLDGDEEVAKKMPPMSAKLVSVLDSGGYDLSDLVDIGIGGDKIDLEKLTPALNNIGSEDMRSVMGTSESGKELLDKYQKLVSSNRRSPEALNELYEEMADLVFSEIQGDSEAIDESGEKVKRERKKQDKDPSKLDAIKSRFTKIKSSPEYKAYVSDFKGSLKDLFKPSKPSSAKVASRYLKSVLCSVPVSPSISPTIYRRGIPASSRPRRPARANPSEE